MEGFLNPQNILRQLALRKDMIAADFGCGSGGWVLPLAEILREGKVYAIDILEEPLSALRSKIKSGKILNIETIKSNVEKTSRLSSESSDLVLMTNLLFEVQDIRNVLEEGKRVLKKGGKILIVDWKKESPLGPKEKVSVETIKETAKNLDLKLEREFAAGIYHFGLILVK